MKFPKIVKSMTLSFEIVSSLVNEGKDTFTHEELFDFSEKYAKTHKCILEKDTFELIEFLYDSYAETGIFANWGWDSQMKEEFDNAVTCVSEWMPSACSAENDTVESYDEDFE